jgi:hypothetical protein
MKGTAIAIAFTAVAYFLGLHLIDPAHTENNGMAGLGILLFFLPCGLGIGLVGLVIGFACNSGKTAFCSLVVMLMTIALTCGVVVSA